MIIAIPLDENQTDVCVSFGRCPFFMFHDTESGVTQVIENPAAEAQGGAGPKAAQFVVDHDAEALITVRCGENAAEVMKLAEITIYHSESKDALENIEAFNDGKLEVLTHFHAGFHGGHQ